MPTDAVTWPEMHATETHSFRHSRWAARRIASVAMIVLYSGLIWVIFGNGTGAVPDWIEVALLASAALFATIFLILSRHPVSLLRVGPDGLEFPFKIYQKIEWHEVERASYVPYGSPAWSAHEWLRIELRPGRARHFSPSLAGFFRRWFTPRSRLYVPLHDLRAPSGDVLSSVERFVPVVESEPSMQETERLHPGAG